MWPHGKIILKYLPSATMKTCPIVKHVCHSRITILPNSKWDIQDFKIVRKVAKFLQIWSHCILTLSLLLPDCNFQQKRSLKAIKVYFFQKRRRRRRHLLPKTKERETNERTNAVPTNLPKMTRKMGDLCQKSLSRPLKTPLWFNRNKRCNIIHDG